MKTIVTVLTCSLIFFTSYSQTPAQIAGNDVEIGIIEHLGDTIPLNLKFSNEKDSLVSLRSLINKPTVISFVYFDCPGLCSPLLDGIADVVSKMDLALGKDYNIVTISFNTKDTPEKARIKKLNFIQKIKEKDRVNWTYLTGDYMSSNVTNTFTLGDSQNIRVNTSINFIIP